MRMVPVEIYSDATNAAVMRHPDRKFPGVLVQGDSLYAMCWHADQACLKARPVLGEDDYEEINQVRNALWALLSHYKSTLVAHDLSLPFEEIPPVS